MRGRVGGGGNVEGRAQKGEGRVQKGEGEKLAGKEGYKMKKRNKKKGKRWRGKRGGRNTAFPKRKGVNPFEGTKDRLPTIKF